MRKIPVVDLFCGVGGLTNGFVQEKGFNIIAGIDFDKSCKYAYEINNKSKFLYEDITVIHPQKILDLYPKNKPKVLVGCAPCQAFSSYNKNKKNEKWRLLYSFSRIINFITPDVVSMENVPQLLKYDNGKVFNDFYSNLISKGYHVSYSVVNAQDYGVPQRRKRLILFASRMGEINIIAKTHKEGTYVTVKDAIGDLPKIKDGEECKTDKLHRARELSSLNKKRIKATPYGGGWKDWDKSLMLECHKKESGKSFGSVYGRMKWEEVAPTLTTQCTGLGNGRFGHPEQNRAISQREASLLQSFPKDYIFIEPNKVISRPSIDRQIGNAVPVLLGKAIARTIKKHLKEYEK